MQPVPVVVVKVSQYNIIIYLTDLMLITPVL